MILLQLGLVVVLLLFSAFFSSSETALFSLTAAQQEDMKRQRTPGYKNIKRLLSEPRRLIVTILLGNELANLLLSAITASMIIQLFGDNKGFYNILIATPLLLLVGEITPKALAVRNNRAFSTFNAPILISFALFITPARVAVRSISDWLITLLVGPLRTQSNLISEDMVLTLARAAVGEGELDKIEAHYINQIFKFGDATVDDAMVPRSNMLFISVDATPKEVIQLIQQYKRDKLVVYKEKHDQVVGLLFARDLLALDLSRKRRGSWLNQLARKPFLVPETRSLLDLFHQMRASQTSVALVIDEYGGIIGQITIHDVLDFVFGDTPNIEEPKPESFKKIRLKGNMEVADFNRTHNKVLPTEHGDTLNGLLIHQHGELPAHKASIILDQVAFTVLKVTGNRITEILAEPAKPKHFMLGKPHVARTIKASVDNKVRTKTATQTEQALATRRTHKNAPDTPAPGSRGKASTAAKHPKPGGVKQNKAPKKQPPRVTKTATGKSTTKAPTKATAKHNRTSTKTPS